MTILSYVILVTVGGILNIMGALLTSIARDFDIRAERAGDLVSAQFFGYLCSVLITGHLADRLGKLKVIVGGLVVLVNALLVFALVRNWSTMMVSQIFVGLGVGGVVSAAVGLVSELNPETRSSVLGIAQAAVGGGALSANWLAAWFLERGAAWSAPLLVQSGVNALICVLLLRFSRGWSEAAGDSGLSLKAAGSLLQSPVIRTLIVINGLTVGAQTMMTTFSAPYLELVLGSRASVAALAPSAFWLGITVGRGIYSSVIEHLNKDLVWTVNGAVATLLVIIVPLFRSSTAAIILIGLIGAIVGSQVPSALARSNLVFTRQTGLASGALFASAAIGSILMIAVASRWSEATSLRSMFWLAFLALLLSSIAVWFFTRRFSFRDLSMSANLEV